MAPLRRLCLALIFAIGILGFAPAMAAPAPSVALEHALGNPKAKVTVIEYGSAACPHCARFNNEVFGAFKAKYVDTGKVRYVFREYLTNPQSFAITAFLMARCAGDDKYFAVLDAVFHAQDGIFASGDLLGGLFQVGAKFGLTPQRINTCMDDKAMKALDARMALADKDQVEAVPSFLIGKTRLEGEQDLAQISAVIDPMLAR
jgi:protein-disulfide isomerase